MTAEEESISDPSPCPLPEGEGSPREHGGFQVPTHTVQTPGSGWKPLGQSAGSYQGARKVLRSPRRHFGKVEGFHNRSRAFQSVTMKKVCADLLIASFAFTTAEGWSSSLRAVPLSS